MAVMLAWVRRFLPATLVIVLLAAPALAADPDPETLDLARRLATKTSGDSAALIQGLGRSLGAMFQKQMQVTQPERTRAVVDEAIVPVLSKHYDELLDLWAKSYATTLSPATLRAAVAFYDSPAGQEMGRVQGQLTQARVTALSQWANGLQGELRDSAAQVMRAHGWDKG